MKPTKSLYFVSLIICLMAVLPPFIYWQTTHHVPTVLAKQAKSDLQNLPSGSVVLMDVRPSDEYKKYHIKGAVNIPIAKMKSQPDGEWQDPLRHKEKIFVICNIGVESAQATRLLIQKGYSQTNNIDHGLDGWLKDDFNNCQGDLCMLDTPRGVVTGITPKTFPMYEQVAIVAAAFGLKPLYELISLVLVIILWKRKSPELTALRRGLLAFFIGENACAFNFLFFNDHSYLLEYWHSLGMAISFGLISYAAILTIDTHIIHFSNKKQKCTLISTCTRCYKYGDATCKLHSLLPYFIIGTGLLGCMPLFAQTNPYFYVGSIFKDHVLFGHALLYQMTEMRLCPLFALIFILASWMTFVVYKEKGFFLSQILFAMALGPLAFGMMRFIIYGCYHQNPLWADFWEEGSEFIFIVFFITVILWKIRKGKPGRVSR